MKLSSTLTDKRHLQEDRVVLVPVVSLGLSLTHSRTYNRGMEESVGDGRGHELTTEVSSEGLQNDERT